MSVNVLKTIQNFPYFTKEMVTQLEPDKLKLNFNLSYWQKKGLILPVKRGVYVLKSNWDKDPNKDELKEFIAGKLVEPSYLSLEYILQKYALLTEAVYAVTSVTTKSGRRFDGKLGSFTYFSITPKLFTGYRIKNFRGNYILEATKAKAMFDYLYLRSFIFSPFNKDYVESLRINWENFAKRDILEFNRYVKLSGNKKLRGLI